MKDPRFSFIIVFVALTAQGGYEAMRSRSVELWDDSPVACSSPPQILTSSAEHTRSSVTCFHDASLFLRTSGTSYLTTMTPPIPSIFPFSPWKSFLFQGCLPRGAFQDCFLQKYLLLPPNEEHTISTSTENRVCSP